MLQKVLTHLFYVDDISTLSELCLFSNLQIHRLCMAIALVMNIIAFIIIFVEIGGYSQVSDFNSLAANHNKKLSAALKRLYSKHCGHRSDCS